MGNLINITKRNHLFKTIGIIVVLLMSSSGVHSSERQPAAEIIEAVMIGDQVVDISYRLGVLPRAMSVRGSVWKTSQKLKTASNMLGCPNYVTNKSKDALPNALQKYGLKKVIVEKRDSYCLYKPRVKPENIVPILEGKEVEIVFVDFSKGFDDAIRQVSVLVGREKQAEELIKRRATQLAKMEEIKPAAPLGRSVVVINGVMQKKTGKSFLRVELPGGYSDRYLLDPLGCKNIGDGLVDGKKGDKGHVTVRSLAGLAELKPDVIVITGDSAPVQKALQKEAGTNGAFAEIPAVKNHAIYSLPEYVDSSVIDYPQIFAVWTRMLTDA